MKVRLERLPLLLAGALLLVGCAPKRPVLYPNRTLEEMGHAGAQRDIEECLALAEAYGLEARPDARTAKSAMAGGAVGAAAGAASGAVRGDPGRHAGAWGPAARRRASCAGCSAGAIPIRSRRASCKSACATRATR